MMRMMMIDVAGLNWERGKKEEEEVAACSRTFSLRSPLDCSLSLQSFDHWNFG